MKHLVLAQGHLDGLAQLVVVLEDAYLAVGEEQAEQRRAAHPDRDGRILAELIVEIAGDRLGVVIIAGLDAAHTRPDIGNRDELDRVEDRFALSSVSVTWVRTSVI